MDRLSAPPRAWPAVLALLAAAPVAAQSTLFRVSDLDLRDPHFFVSFVGCRDITDTATPGVSINGEIQTAIQTDENGDGLLDLSYLLEFIPLDQAQGSNFVAAGTGRCTAPMASTTCAGLQTPLAAGDATLDAAAQCLAPLAGTLRPYVPAVTNAAAPCFRTAPATITFDLAGIPLTLQEAQFAATFSGTPATQLGNGLLRGFLSETVANNTLIPANYPLVGGQALSSVLPGGAGNCSATSDKDVNGVSGWWFYFNFTAERVVDTFAGGFRNGFEGG